MHTCRLQIQALRGAPGHIRPVTRTHPRPATRRTRGPAPSSIWTSSRGEDRPAEFPQDREVGGGPGLDTTDRDDSWTVQGNDLARWTVEIQI